MRLPQILTVSLSGEIDLDGVNEIADMVFRLTHRGGGHVRLVLDVSQVTHVDYRGMGVLAARARLFRKAGGDIKWVGASSYLESLLKAAGVYLAFSFYPNEDAAREAFRPFPAVA